MSSVSWVGPVRTNRSGDFNTASDWTTGIVPDSSTTVRVSGKASLTVTSTEANAIAALHIGDSAATLVIASDTLAVGGPSSNAGSIEVANGATLLLSGPMNNTGTIALASSGAATRLAISGHVALTGTGTVALGDSPDNAITSDGAPAQLWNETTITGSGTIGDANLSLMNLGRIEATGSAAALTIAASGTFTNKALVEATGSGGLVIDGAVDNTGTLAAFGGTIDVTGAVSGAGQSAIADASTLTFGGAVSAQQTVTFEGAGTLALGMGQSFAGTVAGFAAGDGIDLENFAYSAGGVTVSGISGTGAAGTDTMVTVKDGSQTATLALLNQYANQFSTNAAAYQLASDGHGAQPGTQLTLAAAPV